MSNIITFFLVTTYTKMLINDQVHRDIVPYCNKIIFSNFFK